jgi:hypothetical protein
MGKIAAVVTKRLIWAFFITTKKLNSCMLYESTLVSYTNPFGVQWLFEKCFDMERFWVANCFIVKRQVVT